MVKVSSVEFEASVAELLTRVVSGEEVVVTKRNQAIARLVPETRRKAGGVKRAVAGLQGLQRRIAARNKSNPITADEVRSAIAEGRR